MKKIEQTTVFNCPTCHETVEFDYMGEHEYVHCPICGMDYVTAKRGGKLTLETFEQTQTEEPILA